nr:translation initiation factor IF-2-like [Misgurnus anguillicaudatus]
MENLPSPAPVSAPFPEEPRVAALPSPAPVSAPVPEEPRVAALPSPDPVSAPFPEEPRVAALPSPAPVSAPVPEEPRVAALLSPDPVSAPVPEEPRVAALHSPAPVSAPVPEKPWVAALPSPAPVSAPVPVEPRVAALHSPAPVSAPVPEEPWVAALPSPTPVSAPVPVEPRVAALPSPAPVSAPVPEEPWVAALPSPMSAQVQVHFNQSHKHKYCQFYCKKKFYIHVLNYCLFYLQQNNEDVFEDMEVDYNSIPQSSPPHDLPVRQAAPLLPSPRKRRAAPTQLQLGEERDVEVRPKRARLAGCRSENQCSPPHAPPVGQVIFLRPPPLRVSRKHSAPFSQGVEVSPKKARLAGCESENHLHAQQAPPPAPPPADGSVQIFWKRRSVQKHI